MRSEVARQGAVRRHCVTVTSVVSDEDLVVEGTATFTEVAEQVS